MLVGGYGLGESVAELTPNSGMSGFEQFSTDNRVRQVVGVLAKIGFVVTPAIVVEGGFRFTRPIYEVRVSGDAEGAPDTTIEETLSQDVVDGSVVWNVSAGAGRRARCRSCTVAPATCASCTRKTRSSKRASSTTRAAALKWWFGRAAAGSACAAMSASRFATAGSTSSEGTRVVPVISGFARSTPSRAEPTSNR